MSTTTTAAGSLWLDRPEGRRYPAPGREQSFDVAVAGGGIAGLITALLLAREGLSVAVLEANRIGHGVTGATTAKVSALQQTVCSQVRRHHGDEIAGVYARASLAGVERIAALVDELAIDCDLERREAMTYAAEAGEVEAVHAEAEAVGLGGLNVKLSDDADLPFRVHAAALLPNQVQLQPLKLCEGLAAAIDSQPGSAVFEDARVLSVSTGSPCRVETPNGAVTADRVVVATHYPVLDRGLYFARLEAQRSYCVAARAPGLEPLAMAISAGSPTRSIRAHGDHLIVGGEGHAAGSREATPSRFAALEEFAARHWEVEALTHRWSAQDPIPYDHLPMIGPYIPREDRLFVTTGYMKWGLSTAAFGAELLRDRLTGRDNDWTSVFDPNRLSLRSAPGVAKLGAKFTVDMVADRLRPGEVASAAEVGTDEGRVVRDGHRLRGVYRDPDGAAHEVSLRCTHLGCLLRFNAAERSWDCPCHGSRFDVDGAVLEGPATKPLEEFPGSPPE